MSTLGNYKKVKEIIDKRRESAELLAEKRTERLHEVSPVILEIDKELRKTGPMIFRAATTGGDIEKIKKENIALNERRREELLRLGLASDFDEVKYTCPDCADTGYIDTKMCACLRELLLVENIKSSGIGNLIEKQSFDNFDLSPYAYDKEIYARMEYNLGAARAFAEGFGDACRGANLLLIGKTGTGKTHISTSIAKEVIKKGYSVLYDSTQNVISAFEDDKFRSGYSDSEPVSRKYLSADLLILDDLGTEFVNQFTVSCLYNLINTRKNKGLSTVISTNLSAKELSERYDDRIYSRIVGSDYKVLLFDGRDYRLHR